MAVVGPSKMKGKPKASGKSSCGCMAIMLLVLVLVVTGTFLTMSMAPSGLDSSQGVSTNSLLARTIVERSKKLSERIREWIGRTNDDVAVDVEVAVPPPWEQEFWTPIDIMNVGQDPIVILCKLNFQKYTENPHLAPMFKDLVGMSQCQGGNRRREFLKTLLEEIKNNPDLPSSRVVKPNGFVFHESRVGSTLVANFMASDPYALVFSESTPMASAILHCGSCSHEYSIKLFRDVTTLMGRSPFHKYLFFKFQSITVTNMNIALEAYPEVPWAFVYRQPVQTMMSHMDPAKGNKGNAPCMRSKRDPPKDVSDAIAKYAPGWSAPNEAWCAAHLNMLCSFALRNYEKFGTYMNPVTGQLQQRGLLINYDSLPGYVPHILLPHFGINPLPPAWLLKITEESNYYSKSRGSKLRTFTGDSQDKDSRATKDIQTFAESILAPSFAQLEEKAKVALLSVSPSYIEDVARKNSISSAEFQWKLMSPLPTVEELLSSSSTTSSTHAVDAWQERPPVREQTTKKRSSSVETLPTQLRGVGHSTVLKEKEFVPWAPFANHHSSKSFQPARCPMMPEPDYPQAFSMLDITNNWNADSTEIPPQHYDALCHFDYQNATQLEQAYNYRAAEKPFVVYNMPEIDEVVRKWNDIDYLHKRLGSSKYRTEVSENNHFMYWRQARGSFLRTAEGAKWKPPTDIVSTTFEDWIEFAVKNQNRTMDEREHQYFRVSSDMKNAWLFDELPFFKPVKNLLLVEPREQKGIHCRFGMRSVIAEAHFDGTRNSVVELAGMRRWILTHPDQCSDMHMLQNTHPSGRHSAVDWSKPDVEKYPNFAKVKGNEVILVPGDFLFVPTYWIHYIVSLNINIQCNSRSGKFNGYNEHIRKCGF